MTKETKPIKRLGLAFTGQPYRLPDLIRGAQDAERAGFESIWVAEDFWTGRDATSVLACLALSTERIKLGTSVISVYARHPAIHAMMMNTMADLAPERLILGLGAGGRTFRAMVAEDMATWPPLRAMRQSVRDFRALIAGERVTWGEAVVSLSGSDDCFSLGALPVEQVNVPVYIGAVGPRMTELAGEIADGILFEIHTRLDQMPEKLAQITRGAQRVGRALKDVDLASIIVTSVSRDGTIDDVTLCWVAQFVARLDDAEVTTLGFDPELVTQIKSKYRRRSFHAAGRLVTPEMISAFAAAGTAEQCQAMIERYVAAGADLPILVPFGGDLQQLIEMGEAYIHS